VQAQQSANAGKLPVVEYKGSRPEKVGKGTTRVPLFEVVSWVARPAALQDGGMGGADDESTSPFDAPKPVAKPAPSKPAPSQSDDEMFS
jgi:hypothetical protein